MYLLAMLSHHTATYIRQPSGISVHFTLDLVKVRCVARQLAVSGETTSRGVLICGETSMVVNMSDTLECPDVSSTVSSSYDASDSESSDRITAAATATSDSESSNRITATGDSDTKNGETGIEVKPGVGDMNMKVCSNLDKDMPQPEEGDTSDSETEMDWTDCDDGLLAEFSDWMGSVAGGLRSIKTRSMYVHGARQIMIWAGGFEQFSDKLDDMAKPGEFLENQLEMKTPSAVRNYIFALRCLLTFLKHNPQHNVSREFCDLQMEKSTQWLRSMRKKLAQSKQDIMQRDANIVDKLRVAVASYGNSPGAKAAITLLEGFQPGCAQLLEDVMLARNFIITKMLLVNAKRAGPIRNMLLREVHEMRELPEKKYVIKVSVVQFQEHYATTYIYCSTHL